MSETKLFAIVIAIIIEQAVLTFPLVIDLHHVGLLTSTKALNEDRPNTYVHSKSNC